MNPSALLWVEGVAGAYIAWQAIDHINRESTKAWAATTLYWALLGAAAMWAITGALSDNRPDTLRVLLLVGVAAAIRFDRLSLLRLHCRLRALQRWWRQARRRLKR